MIEGLNNKDNIGLEAMKDDFVKRLGILALGFGYKREVSTFEQARELIDLQVVPNPSRRDVLKNIGYGLVAGSTLGYTIDVIYSRMGSSPASGEIPPPGKGVEFLSMIFACIAFWINPQNGEMPDEQFRKMLIDELISRKIITNENDERVGEFFNEIKQLYSLYKEIKRRS